MNGFLTLCKSDWIKGLVMVVMSAVLTWLLQVLNAPGFDFATIQWGEVMKIAVVTGITYMSKNAMTTNSGNLAGVIPLEK